MDTNEEWRFGVIGNIVKEHISEDGRILKGTKEFAGGTRVYIEGKNWYNYPRTEIVVIGLARYKKYTIASVDPALIENIRFKLIRKREVLRILSGVESLDRWHWWERTAADKKEAKWFVENWDTIVAESIENRREENE